MVINPSRRTERVTEFLIGIICYSVIAFECYQICRRIWVLTSGEGRRELLNFHRNNSLFCNSFEYYQICKRIWALTPVKGWRELLNFHRHNTLFCNSIECHQICKGIWALTDGESYWIFTGITLFCNSIECYQICKGIWALDPPGLKKKEV